MRLYSYIGPDAIRERSVNAPRGRAINSLHDLRLFLSDAFGDRAAEVVGFTYVVNLDGVLLVADRSSEHVACAGGQRVLAAGELFLEISRDRLELSEISNLSTGYCPEPECWQAVAQSLANAGLSHGGGFTTTCVFRKCPSCGMRNVVKDQYFFCAVCDSELPRTWNFE